MASIYSESVQELRNITGTVFNIQHYCIHDGPGIRTNVFLKGCPLSCKWCANPESQHVYPELLFRKDKCTGCGRCAAVCTCRAIQIRDNYAVTDRSLCKNCGACTKVCPNEARTIAGTKKTAGEVADEVLEEKLFYGTEGGVTVTGGEAFAQAAFTDAVIRVCREGGITTAVETCGEFSWKTVGEIFRNIDYVLYDIKEMNAGKHMAFTGADNRVILENLKHISDETDCTVFIRCPVITGCNDTAENYHLIAEYLEKNKIRFKEINLLPYHNLGVGKREELEIGEAGFETTVPSADALAKLKQILLDHNSGWTVTC